MTKVKFCGLTRLQDIDFANELKPDFIGFVFAPQSKRCITPEHARELKARLSPEIKAVGVFVDESIDVIAGLCEQGIIDVVQLHGSESNDYIRQLRHLTGKSIIKAFIIKPEYTSNRVTAVLDEAEQSRADYMLLDTGMGSGRAFNWELIRNFSRKYFLAGGLTPENVNEAVTMLKPFAADTSTGIESGGLKDKDKMAKFIQETKRFTPPY
ncbi:MAG: phosphoribosylanthranilate isomerase [Synergistaceae bacterium]|nr:phosphoribosylanthranilate isomerase [Synergistaceae bacterium]